MGAREDRMREERALDALIVMALRLQDPGPLPLPDLNGPPPLLRPEDQRALDALGPDLVERLMRPDQGRRPARRRTTPRKPGHVKGRSKRIGK
ncbi:MAG TPA: hypothetical protein VG013_08250 [Gemmataceae bacterium]|jgi:hypothetical protein|nr:hypothetical protein [Gemmataceae bacterium]